MKVAITSADTFVAPYLEEMLGDSAILVPGEALADPMTLDALLTPCSALTSHSTFLNFWTLSDLTKIL